MQARPFYPHTRSRSKGRARSRVGETAKGGALDGGILDPLIKSNRRCFGCDGTRHLDLTFVVPGSAPELHMSNVLLTCQTEVSVAAAPRAPLIQVIGQQRTLLQSLLHGKLKDAALDVVNAKPLTLESLLLSAPNLLLSPHARRWGYARRLERWPAATFSLLNRDAPKST